MSNTDEKAAPNVSEGKVFNGICYVTRDEYDAFARENFGLHARLAAKTEECAKSKEELAYAISRIEEEQALSNRLVMKHSESLSRAREETREACARVCDNLAIKSHGTEKAVSRILANAIRQEVK